MRGGLDDGGVGLAAWSEGAEEDRASDDREENESGEDDVLPDGRGHEGDALALRKLVVLGETGRAAHNPSRHRPLVDSQLDDEEQVQADERDEQARNDEHVQREEARQRRAGDDRRTAAASSPGISPTAKVRSG